MTSFQTVLDALQAGGYKLGSHNGVKAAAQCPGHEDRNPSLSITHHGDKTLIYCHGGCGSDLKRILAPLKLTPDDLFDNPRPTYTYTYPNGKPQRRVHRTPGKQFYQSGDKDIFLLYGIPRIREFKAAGKPIHLVEGEKDADTVNHLGGCGTTGPQGANSVGQADMSELKDADVIAVRDLDDAGLKWAEEVQLHVGPIAKSLVFKVSAAGKDVSDHVAAGHPLEELLDDPRHFEPAELERDPWEQVDLTQVLAGDWEPPTPTIGRRSDGKGLFYPGKCHTVVGETEGGKTWFALGAAIDEMHERHYVLYFDFEDTEGAVVGRLLTLGISREIVGTYFHYLRPDMPLNTQKSHDKLRELIGDTKPTLAIIDGITEAMTVHDLNPLDNTDAAKFGRILPKKLTAAGLAVANLDHVTKDRDNRGRYAIGAVHKLNALDGAGYILENRTPFGIGLTGTSTIRIAKDRIGQLRRNALPSGDGKHWFGDLVIKSEGDQYADLAIHPPLDHEAEERPTALMQKISALLEDKGPLSKNKIEGAIRGKAEYKRQALTLLILDGYVSDGNATNPHKFIKKFEG